jgi:CHAT domain-containing protein/Tfp pilus assembly protein PilF
LLARIFGLRLCWWGGDFVLILGKLTMNATAMRFTYLLLILISFLAISPAYGQKKAKVDTVAAYRAFKEGYRLEKLAKYDSAIIIYQQAAEGYKAYAISLPEKKKWAASKNRAWEQHFKSKASISLCLTRKGLGDSALKLLLEAKTVCSQVLGDSNTAMARIMNYIGVVYRGKGQYTQALEYYQQSIAIFKRVLGEQNLIVSSCLNNIGAVYSDQGQYLQALAYYQRALSIRKQIQVEQHPDVALSYSNIGVVYNHLALFAQALQFHHQALVILKQAYGENHPNVAHCYNHLGNVQENLSQYVQALASYQHALTISEQTLGDIHPKVGQCYYNIGNVYKRQGQYTQALLYYQQALVIHQKSLGERHPDVAMSYNNIGTVYSNLGQNAQALNYYHQALVICKQVFGEQHTAVASIYNNIGNVYSNQGQFVQALEYYQQAIPIYKQAFGEKHHNVAKNYHIIGNVYSSLGQFVQALEYYQNAMPLFRQALGKQHPDVAISYNKIGSVFRNQGQYTVAIEQYKNSLNSYLPNYATAGYRSMLSNSPEVLQHPLTNLPLTLLHRNAPGDDTFALATVRFADRFIDSLRRTYTYENDKLELGGNANKLYQVAIDVAKWNKQDEEAFYYSEKNKAAVLAQTLNEATALKLGGIPDSLLERDKELRTLVAFYTKASIDEELNCPQCDTVKLQNLKNGLFTHQQQHTALKARLESEFPQYFALKYKDAKISVKEVQQGFLAENPNSAILEYLLGDSVLYAFCITKDKYTFHRQKLDSTRFKNTNALQLEVKKLGRALADAKLFLDPTTVVSQPACTLYDYLIKPFEQQIQGKDLIIIPDGELNKISFEILVKPDLSLKSASKWQELPYLIKQHNISYHYSANLLLEDWQKNKTQPVKSSGFVAFAPVFDDSATGKIVSNENVVEKSYLTYVSREDTVSRAFTKDGKFISPLPGTEREVKAIFELFNQKNQPAKYYLNDQANESTVKSLNLKPYKYLHFATHGLTDEDRPTNSCLILAQKNHPLHSPLGEGPGEGSHAPNSDNLLTSSEMYGLELDAELVVLSACQTGKGTLKAGEGIIGLTRGLLYAGARNLLVSQWNVNDASTAELMTKFYSKILASQSNRQALREAKLELLNSKFACPHYWSAFVLVGR